MHRSISDLIRCAKGFAIGLLIVSASQSIAVAGGGTGQIDCGGAACGSPSCTVATVNCPGCATCFCRGTASYRYCAD